MKFLSSNKFFNRYLPLALSVILLATAGFFWEASTARASYTYTRSLTLQSSQIPANQSSFTVLVCANVTLGNGSACPTVAGLNQTGGGAHVQNSSGFDITFWTSSNCTGAMNWEMEKYVASTGEMEAWVLITSLSTSGNTIYMCYGNSGISSFQGGSVGSAWDGNYLAVYHFPNGSSLSAADSINLNNGTIHSATATSTGQIDGAAAFPGVPGDYVGTPSINLGTSFSVEAWAMPSTQQGNYPRIAENNFSNGFFLGTAANTNVPMFIVSSDFTTTGGTIPVGTTKFLAGTFSGNTSTLYVNGANVSSHGSITNPSIGSAVISIGDYIAHTDSTSAWNGMLDEVRFSKIARSANWITTEYNNESAPSTFENFGSETNNTPSGGNFTRISIQNMRASIQNARVSITGN